MASHRISHIALHVESLRQAERFYRRLFGLEVLQSTERPESGDLSPPAPDGRREPAPGEAASRQCLLGRGEFRLLLRGDAAEPAADGRLAHVCLLVPAADLEGLCGRALALGCRIVQEEAGRLVLEDVYAVRWHVIAGGTGSAERCTALRR